jgi:hypothetical protein
MLLSILVHHDSVSHAAYSSVLKIEAAGSTEMSVAIHQTTQPHVPEDGNLHIHRHENFGSNLHFPAAAARGTAQVRSCRICGGQSGTGAGFLRVLRLPQPIFIPPIAPHSLFIIRGWYNRPVSGRRTKWTQSHPTPRY